MKRHDTLLKERAVLLRRQGKSYGDISKELEVSKSTASLWLRHIPLSPEHRAKLYTKQIEILTSGPKSQKERRLREIALILKEAKTEIQFPLTQQALLLMGAAVYWGEGSKGNRAQITNSDPSLILFMIYWIEKILRVPSENLRAKLNIYPQQDELLIKKFWSTLTGIPLINFGKSYVKPLSKGYKKNNLYYGTIRIEIPKGANIRHRIFGWIKAATEELTPSSQILDRRWGSLREVKRPANL
ncbi:MAG: hypothetical protein HYT50_00725 [Candidatus Wildermuthbacteria bacterium]|nr:hypothetical protein [Candidatus Wildermuthbacteria bacterium]